MRWVFLGTLLPDLIDKPAYFLMGLVAYLDHSGWVPGKRGIAHTLLFLATLASIAQIRRSRPLAAVAIGVTTHLILDLASKGFGPEGFGGALAVLLWPVYGISFPTLAYGLHGAPTYLLEALGATILLALCVRRGSAKESR